MTTITDTSKNYQFSTARNSQEKLYSPLYFMSNKQYKMLNHTFIRTMLRQTAQHGVEVACKLGKPYGTFFKKPFCTGTGRINKAAVLKDKLPSDTHPSKATPEQESAERALQAEKDGTSPNGIKHDLVVKKDGSRFKILGNQTHGKSIPGRTVTPAPQSIKNTDPNLKNTNICHAKQLSNPVEIKQEHFIFSRVWAKAGTPGEKDIFTSLKMIILPPKKKEGPVDDGF